MVPNTESFLVLLFVIYSCSCTTPSSETDSSEEDCNNANMTYESSSSSEKHVVSYDANGKSDDYSLTTTTIKFYYYAPNDTVELNSTNLQLVNLTQPTKVIFHGVGGFQNQVWMDRMIKNYHIKGGYNIIAVDWSTLSTNDTYFIVSVIDSLGQYVGDFIMDISVENYDHLKDVHLIGSNVGAQVAGATGEAIARKGKGKVGRITGLDPTKPENMEILDEDDADFVDAIHTIGAYGEMSVGTVDFYVTADKPNVLVCVNDSCGELLAEDYFIQSITDADRFEGVSCYTASAYIQKLCDKANSAIMGEHVPKNITGNYLVKDSASGKFSKEKYVLYITILLILVQCAM